MQSKQKSRQKPAFSSFGADDGNRTRVSGLGSEHSAIELHPREFILAQDGRFVKGEKRDFGEYIVVLQSKRRLV